MASDPSDPAISQAQSDSTTFKLQIISPSVGVPQPLVLHGLPFHLTVGQLKERIRNAIATKPADQAQRLIHRGRLLSRDNETMADVFSEESLRSVDHQAVHLVLRDLSDSRPASTPTLQHAASNGASPAPGQQPAGSNTPNAPPQPQPQPHPHPHPHLHHHHHHQHYNAPLQPHAQVRITIPNYPGFAFGPPQGPVPGMPATGQPVPPQAQYNPWARAMNAGPHMGGLNQQNQNFSQRDRVPMGPQGAPDASHAATRGAPGTSTPGSGVSPFQPDSTRTMIREGIGPNGAQWRITVNESFVNPHQRPGRTASPLSTADGTAPWIPQARPAPSNGTQLSNNDVQSILRAADASSATRVMADAMRRNASSSSLANLASSQAQHPIPPGVTTPSIPSRAGSAAGTPDPFRASGQPRSSSAPHVQAQFSQATPEVYILTSPSGPRALLLNTPLETYFSPPGRAINLPPGMPFPHTLAVPPAFNLGRQYVAPTPTTQLHNAQAGGGQIPNAQAHHPPQHPQPQVQLQHGLPQPPQAPPQLGHIMARADNPHVQAVRIAQLWPHVWMIIRLGLFIWWFTSPTSSWSRWVTVISIAVTLFLINTGLLNPIAEQFWVPLRRHLESLIPLADGHHRNARPARAENGRGAAGDPGPQRELDPADTAAMLVRQRRNANANWLMNQARRLERAGILFLASIAPGVAERHIAQMEAEVRAERRRREAEAEAAAIIAAEATAAQQEAAERSAEDGGGGGGSTATPATRESERQDQVAGDEREDNGRLRAAAEPVNVL
ncbi:hypothetical protein GGS23DRAFT_165061 [Durotheca rogersii]|uniref:uncharacterized protein n=1 Tax=Durotheca rogersii TaxID=419775 RepID=UPI00221F5ED1|nr:uncharacterized protein GGS23DRAFT_165061 [Durotheca rogersii]KAI5867183.1 hypothetical protein GGS23DRAFT_165061 [Durotheca rogersii]